MTIQKAEKNRSDIVLTGFSFKNIIFQGITANLTLAGLKGVTAGFTQPIQVVMRYQQAALVSNNPRKISPVEAAREIWQSGKSFGKFFNGVIPGIIKEVSKNAFYKGILMH